MQNAQVRAEDTFQDLNCLAKCCHPKVTSDSFLTTDRLCCDAYFDLGQRCAPQDLIVGRQGPSLHERSSISFQKPSDSNFNFSLKKWEEVSKKLYLLNQRLQHSKDLNVLRY